MDIHTGLCWWEINAYRRVKLNDATYQFKSTRTLSIRLKTPSSSSSSYKQTYKQSSYSTQQFRGFYLAKAERHITLISGRKSNYCRNKTYFHKNSADKMNVPIKEDMKRRNKGGGGAGVEDAVIFVPFPKLMQHQQSTDWDMQGTKSSPGFREKK